MERPQCSHPPARPATRSRGTRTRGSPTPPPPTHSAHLTSRSHPTSPPTRGPARQGRAAREHRWAGVGGGGARQQAGRQAGREGGSAPCRLRVCPPPPPHHHHSGLCAPARCEPTCARCAPRWAGRTWHQTRSPHATSRATHRLRRGGGAFHAWGEGQRRGVHTLTGSCGSHHPIARSIALARTALHAPPSTLAPSLPPNPTPTLRVAAPLLSAHLLVALPISGLPPPFVPLRTTARGGHE